MSSAYKTTDPLELAKQAERDLNSQAAKQATESGIDESVERKFPGASVTYGSAASGSGDNRVIPESEGGSINPSTGKLYKARDFEGEGGPEDKARIHAEESGGADDVRGNVRN